MPTRHKEAAIATGDPYVHEFGRYKFDKAVDLRNPLSSSPIPEWGDRLRAFPNVRVNIPTSGDLDKIKGDYDHVHIPQDDA